jgi:F0F1-type ATP synthase epsilon subunit
MKLILAFALLTSSAVFAEDHKEAAAAAPMTSSKADLKKEDKQAAYKIAKEACLKENKDLKGEELKNCIVNKNK